MAPANIGEFFIARITPRLLPAVLGLRRCLCLPMHIDWVVRATVFERLNMVNNVAATRAIGLASCGARMHFAERLFGVRISCDLAVRVAFDPSSRRSAGVVR